MTIGSIRTIPDARITKMKDGRTQLAHKAEHAVDMETGSRLSPSRSMGLTRATLRPFRRPWPKRASASPSVVADTDNDEVAMQVSAEGPRELVTEKGYHSRAVVTQMAEWGVRTYCSEPDRGRQRWPDLRAEQRAVYANRRRIRGERGRRLLRQRGEKLERWNQPLYDRGGMRRVHLRGRENILKRLMVHSGAANLGLLMRKLFGKGTPRALQGRLRTLLSSPGTSPRLFSGTATLVSNLRRWMVCRRPVQVISAVVKRPV